MPTNSTDTCILEDVIFYLIFISEACVSRSLGFKHEKHTPSPNDSEPTRAHGPLDFLVLSLQFLWKINVFFFSHNKNVYVNHQIRSVAQLCPTLCDPMNRSTPGLPVHHQLPEFIQTHVHRVSDAIQPSHPLASPSPPAPNPSQHQSLFQ